MHTLKTKHLHKSSKDTFKIIAETADTGVFFLSAKVSGRHPERNISHKT